VVPARGTELDLFAAVIEKTSTPVGAVYHFADKGDANAGRHSCLLNQIALTH
jgi:hypothetical protein